MSAGAFRECASLSSVKLLKGVKKLGSYAFTNTRLSSMTIPSSVTSISEFIVPQSGRPFTICGVKGSEAERFVKNDIFGFYRFTAIPETAPSGVSIAQGKSASLAVGKKLTLTAAPKPESARTRLVWSTSNAKVATVTQKGVVTARKAGTVRITVATGNGKKASIKITVKKK